VDFEWVPYNDLDRSSIPRADQIDYRRQWNDVTRKDRRDYWRYRYCQYLQVRMSVVHLLA